MQPIYVLPYSYLVDAIKNIDWRFPFEYKAEPYIEINNAFNIDNYIC